MGRRQDYDSPWKGMLERYFQDFMALFFPRAHEEIDWDRGYSFLDKELRQVARDARLGKRVADKLVRVVCRDGSPAGVLIHIEVQDQADTEFPRRMYVYNYRLFDRYGLKVASFAVLGDDRPDWRPCSYGYELWGSCSKLRFPIVKLIDCEKDWEKLERAANPFAVFVMAHLKTVATRRSPEERLYWKLSLIKMLYKRGYSRQDILDLFHFIDWLMDLPEEMEQGFLDQILEFEKENQMPYVNTAERLGMKRGLRKGLQKGLQRGMQKGLEKGVQKGTLKALRESVVEILEVRFGATADIETYLLRIEDPAILKELHRRALQVDSLEDFERETAQRLSQ